MIYLPNNSIIKVHDIFDPLPDFMLTADIIFTDVPYNQTMLTNYSNREDVVLSLKNTVKFEDFTVRFFECISKINPQLLFIEVGKESLANYIVESEKLFKYVTFYNSTYYHKIENKSYVIHATNIFSKRKFKDLEDKDEEDIIQWVCKNCSYGCIGDLCIGKGLVGKYAFLAGKKFVGIDINFTRMKTLIDFIDKTNNLDKFTNSPIYDKIR